MQNVYVYNNNGSLIGENLCWTFHPNYLIIKHWKEPVLCPNGWNWLSGSREGKESVKKFQNYEQMLNNRKLILKLWFGELKITEIAKDGPHGLKKKLLSACIKFACHI